MKNEILKSALKTASTKEIEIYWDRQDSNNVGAAYREMTGPKDQRESGGLEFVEWAHISGRAVTDTEVEGYNLGDFFRQNDAYAGPDQHGIYPVLA